MNIRSTVFRDLQHAMSVLVGGWGAGFIALIVLLFAFSSIVANYVYAENNLVFLRLDKPRLYLGAANTHHPDGAVGDHG